jgi:hypothetical protein
MPATWTGLPRRLRKILSFLHDLRNPMTNSDMPEENLSVEAVRLAQTIQDLRQSKRVGIKVLGPMLERYGCSIRFHIREAGAAPADLDDLQQAVIEKLLVELPKTKTEFRTVGKFRKWVGEVAETTTIDALRRRNRNPAKRSLE